MELLSLSQYAKHKNGTYVSLEMSQESKNLLDNYVEMTLDLKERVNPKTYHITVIYSRTPVPAADQLLNMNTPLPVGAQPVSYEIFPTNDGQCLVLRLVCPYATQLNSMLNTKGATSYYNDYKPHVTIAYNLKEDINTLELPIPQFQLIFDNIIVEPLDPLWTPDKK